MRQRIKANPRGQKRKAQCKNIIRQGRADVGLTIRNVGVGRIKWGGVERSCLKLSELRCANGLPASGQRRETAGRRRHSAAGLCLPLEIGPGTGYNPRMLFLLFQLGADRYALEAARVVAVLPLLELKKLPTTPRGVAGLFNYHGVPVPVVDLSDLLLGQPAAERLTTRILLVNHADADGNNHLLGLIAEHVTQIVRKENADLKTPGLRLGAPPFLGPLLLDERGMVQIVHAEKLLPNEVRDLLFAETLESTP